MLSRTKTLAIFYYTALMTSCNFISAMELSRAITERITPELIKAAEAGESHAQYLLGRFHEVGLETQNVQLIRNRDSAGEWYLLAAKSGHAMAQYRMGKRFLKKSENCANDQVLAYGHLNHAIRFFEMAAAQGNILAQFELGCLYKKNNNIHQAFDLFNKVYGNNSALVLGNDPDYAQMVTYAQCRAAYYLGLYHEKGLAVEQSNDRAQKYYQASCEKQFYDRAYYRLARLLRQMNQHEQVKELLKNAVTKDLPAAHTLVADILLEEGKKVEALALYLKAAQSNKAKAQYKLARLLEQDGPNDQSRKWYKKAAEQGYALALQEIQKLAENDIDLMHFLADLLANGKGKGASKNLSQAVEWHKKAIAKNSQESFNELMNLGKTQAEAQTAIGELYEGGLSVERDTDIALDWYERAIALGYPPAFDKVSKLAEKDNHKALYILAHLHWYGAHGIQKDLIKALDYYEKAVKYGSKLAAFILAQHYIKGYNNVPKNVQRAVELLQEAAQKGHPDAFSMLLTVADDTPQAQYVIGSLYEAGKGELRDEKEARKWYEKAAQNNYAPALCALGSLSERQPPLSIDSAQNVISCYNDALRWYEKAALVDKNSRFAKSHCERIQSILAKLLSFSRIPDFLNLSLQRIRPVLSQDISPELYYYFAYITDLTTRRFELEVQAIVNQALIDIAKLDKKGLLALAVTRVLKEQIESPEFIQNQLNVTGKEFRKTSLGLICHGIQLMQSMSPHFKLVGGEVKMTDQAIRDLRIAIFNCLFKIEKAVNDDEYSGAVEEILSIFDKQSAAGTITLDMLRDPERQDARGGRESLEKLLCYHTTQRYKNRIIRIANVLSNFEPKLQAAILASWAIAGLHCSTRAEEETYLFDLANATSSATLDAENLSLEMRVAICLAQLRRNCIDGLVPKKAYERIHQVAYLEKQVAKDLALVGDADGFKDKHEVVVDESYKALSKEQICEKVFETYTVKKIIEHVQKEINSPNSRIPFPKLLSFFETMFPGLGVEIMRQLYDEDGFRVSETGVKTLLTILGYFKE